MPGEEKDRISTEDLHLTVNIRDATPADQPLIVDYNSRLADETEGRKLKQVLLAPGVTAILADCTKGRYWIAMVGDEPVGQIMVTYEWSDWRNGMLWWIQSVYIRAEFRRKGVFSALYAHVESLVTEDPAACGIRLYVEKGNRRAQDTYRNLGFSESGYLVMETLLPNDE
jgi:ribosomal protein S18 acetylase RimI-like enzyme